MRPHPQAARPNPPRPAQASKAHQAVGPKPKAARIGSKPGPRATAARSSSPKPRTYAYGAGASTRHYHAYGHGKGARNRIAHRAFGRSQGDARAIVARLRSVHAGLARLDHDYAGHRVRALHSIATAIRQLSHRSTRTVGSNRGNGGRARLTAQVRARPAVRLSQAQSDARMGQALRTSQGILMQMGGQNGGVGRAQARGHVARAVRELHAALTIR